MRKKRTIFISVALAAITLSAALPAFAQEAEAAVEQTKRIRDWPPAWINEPLEALKAGVEERAALRVERIEESDLLGDDQKAELLAAIDELLTAVASADANAEVVGLVVSRTQLERLELRADRRGEEVDYERHINRDLDRATLRLERLMKVTGWAEAAGEEVETINGYLSEAGNQVDTGSGGGSVTARHDAVHIGLAWMTQAAAALDGL